MNESEVSGQETGERTGGGKASRSSHYTATSCKVDSNEGNTNATDSEEHLKQV